MSTYAWKNAQLVVMAGLVSLFVVACGGGGGTSPSGVSTAGSSGQVQLCTETVTSCFGLGKAEITKYKGAKQAAASYTFDDGLMSAFRVADIFTARQLHASFYINPGLVHDEAEWQRWRDVAAHGHEIGNHSMWHVKLVDASLPESKLKFQILDAQALIAQKTGTRPLIFVFPYDAYDDRSMQMVMSTHIATRLPGFRTDPTYKIADFASSLTIGQANDTLQDVVNMGGWMVAAGHGIDGNGYSPISSAMLEQHLDFAKSLSDKLWVDTFLEVSRYRLCKERAQPDIVPTSSGASIRIKGDFSAGYCTAPLTISIPIVEQPTSQIVLSKPDGAAVPFKQMGMKLIADLVPGEELRLSLKAKQ